MTIPTRLATSVLCLVAFPTALLSQAGIPPRTQAEFPKEAYVFEMLHTRMRFEADGTGVARDNREGSRAIGSGNA